MNPFSALRRHGDRPALITADSTMTYVELADRMDRAGEVLGTQRRLVLIGGANSPDVVVAHLAALASGHVVLLVPGNDPVNLATLVEAYDPDVVLDPTSGDGLVERRAGTRHALHPELALLLSTSGSTGSPRLVRLSMDNVVSNATAIADSLGITADDRALTTLPMHYCYGLSVVHSHVLSGAALVLTEWSVVDECLWRLAEQAEVTSFAGVPYTFDLLDASDFVARDLPSLRCVTQAGGRLAPDRIRSYVDLGRRRGWDFVAMYGQTEATARMAYLPPDLAIERPDALGVPVRGGSFRLVPVPEAEGHDVGELVYAGPNVMMGYATEVADLARGHELTELRTGDLVRRDDTGVLTWVGRRSRLAKTFGLRIDLDEVERIVADHGTVARCVAVDDRVQVFVDRHGDLPRVRRRVAARCGLPEHAIAVHRVRELPRTTSGKTDYASLERQARLAAVSVAGGRSVTDVTPTGLRDLFAELLDRPGATVDDSFTSLGGDSLSYVELAVRLGELGIDLPGDWHRWSISRLAASRPARPRRGVRIEMSIVLRGVAIMLILGTHANLWTVPGGAHLLLALVGYNFARFHLTEGAGRERLRSGLGALLNLVLPSVAWIGAVALVLGTYHADTVVFLNGAVGSDSWTAQWQFWFLEAIVWIQVAVLALVAIPWVHRFERRSPWAFAMTMLAGALVLRYGLAGIEAGPTERYTPSVVLWCFALGWAVARARTPWQRVAVSLAAAVAIAGFFGDPRRELVVLGGFWLLVWIEALRLPRRAARVLGTLAAASLYIYLTHWQVYPHLEDRFPLLAVASSVAVGIAYRHGWESLRHRVRRRVPDRVSPRPRIVGDRRPVDRVS